MLSTTECIFILYIHHSFFLPRMNKWPQQDDLGPEGASGVLPGRHVGKHKGVEQRKPGMWSLLCPWQVTHGGKVEGGWGGGTPRSGCRLP